MKGNQLTKFRAKHKLSNCFKRLLSVNANLSIALIYSFSGFGNFSFLSTENNHQMGNLGLTTSIERRSPSPQNSLSPVTEIVIVDAAIRNPDTLVGNLSANTQVYYLNSDRDGIEQITAILSSYQNLQAIHILAHGRAGQLNLGSGVLNSGTFHSQTKKIKAWGGSFGKKWRYFALWL